MSETVEPQVEATVPVVEPPQATVTPPAPATPEPPSWALSRIDTLTRQRREAEEQAARLQERLVELEARQTAAPPPPLPKAAELTQQQIEIRAQQLAQQQTFQRRIQEVDSQGAAEFSDWNVALTKFQPLGGIAPGIVEAAMELDEPARVIYALSQDLNKAASLTGLSPARQAVALAKFAAALPPKGKAPTVSAAPAPTTGVVGASRSGEKGLDSSDISLDEWITLREKQVDSRKRR